MATRTEIIQYAEDLLDPSAYSDYCPNGLQVEGAHDVTVIASAVSCTLDVFQRAADAGAQLLLVHHGLFWRNTPQVIDARTRQRLRTLFDANLNLVAYHLPLDGHPELGNNALIAAALGLQVGPEPFAVHGGRPIGVIARAAQPVAWHDFTAQVQAAMGQEPLLLGIEPDSVRTIAICSGGGGGEVDAAAAAGADVLLTGEPEEPTHAAATEAGVAFIAAGHYASEVFGVRALGDRLATQFNLQHVFLPAANPV